MEKARKMIAKKTMTTDDGATIFPGAVYWKVEGRGRTAIISAREYASRKPRAIDLISGFYRDVSRGARPWVCRMSRRLQP